MLVSSIGYLDSNKNVNTTPVKVKNSKGRSGFGQVQTPNYATVSNTNYLTRMVNFFMSVFQTKNNKNDNKLSLMA